MAAPMTSAGMTTALKRWGLTVVEHEGWRSNNRNEVGLWGPVHGSMVHHTASADGAGIVRVCYEGRSDLPGPLCHGVIGKSGMVHLVGNGRANHAGSGSSAVLNAVIDETAIPARPGSDAVDGNARFYGWECVNRGDGKDPWPEAQLDAIARVQAAVCDHHGWGAGSVIGHKEWTARKIDPRGFTMASLRARVTAHLKAGPTPTEDRMPLTTDDINKVATAVAIKLIAGGGVLESGDVARVAAAVKALPVTLTDAQIQGIVSSPVLAEAIAERVAAKLAARLVS